MAIPIRAKARVQYELRRSHRHRTNHLSEFLLIGFLTFASIAYGLRVCQYALRLRFTTLSPAMLAAMILSFNVCITSFEEF